MDIAGSKKIAAPREKVFNALFNPGVLKNSIPGCESAEYVDLGTARSLKLVMTTGVPGFKGPYSVFLETKDAVAPSHVVLITEPASSIGTIKASCTVDLVEDAAGTILKYSAHAELSGKIASVPELVVKPAIKGAFEKFFHHFENQVRVSVG
jgi:carbon monoxide dehydrogenase subunit G